MPLTYLEGFAGVAIAGAALWAPFFALAYARRKFGGERRNYALAFAATWLVTVGLFVGLTLLENSGTN